MVRVLCPGHSPSPCLPVQPAPLRGMAACPSAFAPFLRQFGGLELVSRDVFFIDLEKSLSLVNPPILSNLMLQIGNPHDVDR